MCIRCEFNVDVEGGPMKELKDVVVHYIDELSRAAGFVPDLSELNAAFDEAEKRIAGMEERIRTGGGLTVPQYQQVKGVEDAKAATKTNG